MKAINEKDKDKALEQVLADIEKQFGKGCQLFAAAAGRPVRRM